MPFANKWPYEIVIYFTGAKFRQLYGNIDASLIVRKAVYRGFFIMKFRFFSVAVISVLLLNTLGFAAADTRSSILAKKRAAAKLVSLLPASDAIAVFDSKRFLDDALPKVLSANQPMLGEIVSKVKEMESRTGIDLRKLDQVAVGVAMKRVSPTEVDYEPVVTANGDINVENLVSAAKTASKGSFREEKAGARTIYIFSGKDVAVNTTARPANSKLAAAMDKLMAGLTKKEVAVTAYDAGTLVMGSPERVRQTLGPKTNTDTVVRNLLPSPDSYVLAFAARTNGMLGKLLPLDTDMLGENLDSIQFMTGSMDVVAGTTSVQMMARTQKAGQAAGLKDTLEGLQLVGNAFLGNSKRADQQVYGRMLKNAKFAARGTDVMFDLAIPQTDIDILISGLK